MDHPTVGEKNILFQGMGVSYDDELRNSWFIILPWRIKYLGIFETFTDIQRSVENQCIESDLLEVTSIFVRSSLYTVGGRVPNYFELSDGIRRFDFDPRNSSKQWEIGTLSSPCADPVIGVYDDYLYILPGAWKYGYYEKSEDEYFTDQRGDIWDTRVNKRLETRIPPPKAEIGGSKWRRIRACAALDEKGLLIAMDGEENNFFVHNPKNEDWESCDFEDPLPKFIGETSFAASNGRLYILEVRGMSPAFLYIYDIKEGKLVMDKEPVHLDDDLWSMDEQDRVVRIVPVADGKLCFLWLGPVSYKDENMWPPFRILHYLKIKFSVNPNPAVEVVDNRSFSTEITDLLCCLPCSESFSEEVKGNSVFYYWDASQDLDQESSESIWEEVKCDSPPYRPSDAGEDQDKDVIFNVGKGKGPLPLKFESASKVFDRHGEGSLPPGVPLQFRTGPVNARDVGHFGHGDEILVRVDDLHSLSKRISGAHIWCNAQNKGQKYPIHLRGIDAPEMDMEYGKEARDELVKLVEGKHLRGQVYNLDRGRLDADVYSSDGKFLQEEMLKKGFAWHYKASDNRHALAAWEKEAREMRVGLWASPNPEAPWDWREKELERLHKAVTDV